MKSYLMSRRGWLAPAARPSRERAGLWCSGLLLCSLLLSCTATSFVSTWKAPDAQPVDARGSGVVAVVMASSDVMRRTGEDRLAYEISARGAKGIPMYRLLPEGEVDEARARSALERENVKLVVVMRPVQVQQQAVVETYGGPTYVGYWGGYHAYGWGHAYGGAQVRVDTIVSIETLVYSLPQNKLLWGGQSKTTNPGNIGDLVAEVAEGAADQLDRAGLIVKR
jgi:hypothetical protein